MTRPVRRLVRAVVVALAGAVVPAQAQQPVSFVIEAIVVEGVKHGSEKIVVSELLLTLGTAYTEAELREALYRVRRLPFVVDADFSLRRGSERGRHELVVTVSQAWPVFFGGTAAVAGVDSARSDTEWFASVSPQVGGRVFFGGQNEISATISGSATSQRQLIESSRTFFELAYRHHNLFGHHVVGTLFLGKPRSSGRGQQFGASVGVPLSRVSTLNGTFLRDHVEYETSLPGNREGGSGQTSYRGLLSWRLDTTDDPFVPRQGGRLLSELAYESTEATYFTFFDPSNPAQPGTPTQSTANGRGMTLSVDGRHHWAVSARSSFGVGASLRGRVGHTDTDTVAEAWSLEGSFDELGGTGLIEAELLQLLPIGSGRTEFWWSARAFFGASVVRIDNEGSGLPVSTEFSSGSTGVTLSLAARGRWGIARVELSWNRDFLHLETR